MFRVILQPQTRAGNQGRSPSHCPGQHKWAQMKLGKHEGDPSPPDTGFRTAKSRPCLLVWVELSHASWCSQQIKGPQLLERNGMETWQRLIDPGKDKDRENQPSVVLWMRRGRSPVCLCRWRRLWRKVAAIQTLPLAGRGSSVSGPQCASAF